ncbi:hypothetical protein GGR26_003596 [Lewinella marina]|nr:hypothetical protein [Neolewinella marina]
MARNGTRRTWVAASYYTLTYGHLPGSVSVYPYLLLQKALLTQYLWGGTIFVAEMAQYFYYFTSFAASRSMNQWRLPEVGRM